MWTDHIYQIKIHLKSETIFSSGEKERNLVHAKVLADRYGFVYLHAKTLKGQLKRQAFWLLDQYNGFDTKEAKAFFASIIKLFGINREELELYSKFNRNYRQKQGIVKFSNLELDEKIRKYFVSLFAKDEQEQYYNISPHDLIEAQTCIRTGIQLENGVAKDKMMTTYHTVKPGLVFYSTIIFEEDPSSDLKNLYRILSSFRRIGASIHRGRGEVETYLLIDGKEVDRKTFLEERR